MSRRNFLKVAGATGLGSIVTPLETLTDLSAVVSTMPTRPFGRTGVNVPILSFGGSLHLPQIMLNSAFKMKTQGGGSVKTGTERELELADRFLKKGFTNAQAKLKAVWENENIATICSEMPNMSILLENVAAAQNRTRLAADDMSLLYRYAQETRRDYCMGCRNLCEPALGSPVPVGDIMRALMYWRSYGDRARALRQFDQIPADIRSHMAKIDYTQAEKNCPQHIIIGALILEAVLEFS